MEITLLYGAPYVLETKAMKPDKPKEPKELVMEVFRTGNSKKITDYLKRYWKFKNYYKKDSVSIAKQVFNVED